MDHSSLHDEFILTRRIKGRFVWPEDGLPHRSEDRRNQTEKLGN